MFKSKPLLLISVLFVIFILIVISRQERVVIYFSAKYDQGYNQVREQKGMFLIPETWVPNFVFEDEDLLIDWFPASIDSSQRFIRTHKRVGIKSGFLFWKPVIDYEMDYLVYRDSTGNTCEYNLIYSAREEDTNPWELSFVLCGKSKAGIDRAVIDSLRKDFE